MGSLKVLVTCLVAVTEELTEAIERRKEGCSFACSSGGNPSRQELETVTHIAYIVSK